MKLKEFHDILLREDIDVCILLRSNLNKPDSNITYFSNLDLSDFCCLIIYKDKPPKVIVPELELSKSRKISFIKDIIALNNFWEQIKKYAGKEKKIGINFDCISISEYKKFKKAFPKSEMVDISKYLDILRRTKTSSEIRKLKEVCRITDEVIQECFNNVIKFKTEANVVNFLDNEVRKLGLSNSFQTIVASGKNAAMPHHLTSMDKLQKGFCVIDFGIRYENYCSDMTRTLFIGKPSQKEKDVYNLVLKAQLISIKNSKIGARASDIDKMCRQILGKYGKYFIHGLGHQIGIDVHEGSFRLSNKCSDILLKNMVFTIEPGIYINNRFGIRIEDTVLLDKTCMPLTKFTKGLIAIDL